MNSERIGAVQWTRVTIANQESKINHKPSSSSTSRRQDNNSRKHDDDDDGGKRQHQIGRIFNGSRRIVVDVGRVGDSRRQSDRIGTHLRAGAQRTESDPLPSWGTRLECQTAMSGHSAQSKSVCTFVTDTHRFTLCATSTQGRFFLLDESLFWVLFYHSTTATRSSPVIGGFSFLFSFLFYFYSYWIK